MFYHLAGLRANSEVGAGENVFDCYKYSKEPNHLFSNYRYAIFIISL